MSVDSLEAATKTSVNVRPGAALEPSNPEGATIVFKRPASEFGATQLNKSTNERIFLSNESGTGDRFSSTSGSDSFDELPRLIETHEFLISEISATHAMMEFVIGSATKKFGAQLKGLEEIGVVSPSVGDRFKLDIFRTTRGLVSHATKISSAGGLAFPEVAPRFDPAYIEYFKTQLRKEG
jgi:hypothetical protein